MAGGSDEGARMMSSTRPSAESIDLASCDAFETIVAKTGSSVYEVIVLLGERGEVLVRGGKNFATFCPAVYVGSTRCGGAIECQTTIEIGWRMNFYFENLVVVTSAVQSLSRHSEQEATS
jgi:hypothetical protein